MGRYRKCRHAVSERLVSRQTCAALRLLSPLKAPGLTVFGFQFSTVPMSNYNRIYMR